MKRTALLILVLALAFFGLADSWYLTEHALSGTPLLCDGAGLGGCNTVAASPHSNFLGLPLALYGVAFYAFIFMFAALLIAHPRRAFFGVLLVFSGLGLLASVYFMGLQLFVIHATCIYCVTSAVLSALIFVATFFLRKGFPKGHA